MSSLEKKDTQTYPSLAAQYGVEVRAFKRQLEFLMPQLDKLQVIKSNVLTPAQVILIRHYAGQATGQKTTWTDLARLYGCCRSTLKNTWLIPFMPEIIRLQPAIHEGHFIFPKVLGYIESKLESPGLE